MKENTCFDILFLFSLSGSVLLGESICSKYIDDSVIVKTGFNNGMYMSQIHDFQLILFVQKNVV